MGSSFSDSKPKQTQSKPLQMLTSLGISLQPLSVADIVGCFMQCLCYADTWEQSPLVKVFARGVFLLNF